MPPAEPTDQKYTYPSEDGCQDEEIYLYLIDLSGIVDIAGCLRIFHFAVWPEITTIERA